MSTLRGPEFDAGYALPPTFFGDAFLSFGFGGALAACFVLGLVAVRLDLAFKNGVLKSVPLFLIAFANFYSLLRDPLSESLAGILLTLLVWFVGGKALRRTDRLAAAPGAAPGRLWPPSGSLALAP
jgi:hypothetical protein